MQEKRLAFWELIVSVIVINTVHMNKCPILNGYRNTAVGIDTKTGNKKREITRCKFNFNFGVNVWMTNLSQFTINVPKSHRQPQCTFQLQCEDRVLFVWADLHAPLCWQQHPKCIHISFVDSVFIQLHKQKPSGVWCVFCIFRTVLQ